MLLLLKLIVKKLGFVVLLLGSIQIYAQQTYVPDDNFEQRLIDLGYDDVLDDYVLTANIDGVTSLYVSEMDISDLKGIEDFTVLTYLTCEDNQLTTLDFSQNTALTKLRCGGNQLSTLDVSQNTALIELWCLGNQLTTLDVSQNIALTRLNCSTNPLGTLDVSQNTALNYIMCWFCQLTTLDVRNGNNTNMTYTDFLAQANPNLTCIFVDNAAWSAANWTNIDPASTFVETQAECDILSIDEVFLSQSLQVCPNPITNQLFINNPNNLNIQSIQLYDVLGKVVTQEHNNYQQIDVSLLNSGIYLVKIETDKGVVSKKVIKK